MLLELDETLPKLKKKKFELAMSDSLVIFKSSHGGFERKNLVTLRSNEGRSK